MAQIDFAESVAHNWLLSSPPIGHRIPMTMKQIASGGESCRQMRLSAAAIAVRPRNREKLLTGMCFRHRTRLTPSRDEPDDSYDCYQEPQAIS
jgi:hypothetical protein